MVAQKASSSQWSERIYRLLGDLKLTQAGLAERLGVSPPTVSRWIQGRHEPTAESYVALGNLAGRPDGYYFWERAGIDTASLQSESPLPALSSLRISLRDFKVILSKRLSRQTAGKDDAVAIPLLKVTAFADRIPPHENVSLTQVEVEGMLLAPLSWCGHPDHMIAMHLAGDSMVPTIQPNSILFVDTAVKERDRLGQRLTVVAHRDLGFKVARFQRLAGSDLLVSANHKYAPVDVSNASKWKIFGEVLWWVSRDASPPD